MDNSARLQADIKRYPDFSDVDIRMKPYFDDLLGMNPPMASEYTFTNVFIWRHAYRFKLCLLDEALCIKGTDRSGLDFFMVIAKDTDAYTDTIKHLASLTVKDGGVLRLFRVEERFVAPLKQAVPTLAEEYDRDNSDYVYLAADLRELKGRKYDGKRNHIKHFKDHYVHAYADMSDRYREDCLLLTETWYRSKNDERLLPDVIATKEALTHYTELGLFGGVILIDGAVKAFSLAEQLNPDTAVIHIEKYDAAYEGITQTINQQLCEHACMRYTYINREQDLGSPGLRKSKSSYNPVQILRKYRMSTQP